MLFTSPNANPLRTRKERLFDSLPPLDLEQLPNFPFQEFRPLQPRLPPVDNLFLSRFLEKASVVIMNGYMNVTSMSLLRQGFRQFHSPHDNLATEGVARLEGVDNKNLLRLLG